MGMDGPWLILTLYMLDKLAYREIGFNLIRDVFFLFRMAYILVCVFI